MTRKNLETILRLESYGKYYQACSEWANLLEILAISWAYCPGLFKGDAITADFYLPKQNIFFFVDIARLGSQAPDYMNELIRKNERIILGGENGTFRIFEDGEWYTSSKAGLCFCSQCGGWFFRNGVGNYECRLCGADDIKHLRIMYTGDTNLFEFVR